MNALPARALVVGLGRSGQAAALALARHGVEVVATDSSAEVDAGRLAATGVEVRLGTEEESLLHAVEVVVKSPGVPAESPLVADARARGLPVWSEVELGYRLLAPGNRVVGITGTKGKTTTTRLLGAMFAAAGRECALAGNEHAPLSEVAAELGPDAWVVCELSSFQLEDVETLACEVAVLLNVAPDHLNRYDSFDDYRAAKLRIFERAASAVVPRGSGLLGTEFSANDPLPAEPRMPGVHNRENAAAATAAARAAGLPEDAIAEALRDFPGVPHRLELVAELRGVRYVNDSKATNVAAARWALAAYAGDPVHLIAGGSLKGESFEPLADAVGRNVKRVYLIGEAADEIGGALESRGVAVSCLGHLEAAVSAAAGAAEPGDVVVLAPACASFDQYRNFEQRGDHFRRLVEDLR